jgi:hypothetical protein
MPLRAQAEAVAVAATPEQLEIAFLTPGWAS